MELKLFKPLWGHTGSYIEAIDQARIAGFNGIEGPPPVNELSASEQSNRLESLGFEYIAEITTAGSYVPDRNASLQQHIDDFEKKLEQCLPYNPIFINCLGGCDAWPEEHSIKFFNMAIELANKACIPVSFETHRGRSLFNPWVANRIAAAIPSIKLTSDYSHWCVVCERLIDTELDVLARLAKHAYHIHGRVGYEQGPQVPHPRATEYEYALRAHQSWWEDIWLEHIRANRQFTTMTPEFGPDGYLHHAPFTNLPVGDLWEINCWMGNEEQQHFSNWFNQYSLTNHDQKVSI